MKIKLKKLNDKAVVPEYQTEGAAAVDLIATSQEINLEYGYICYGTGIAVEIPEGYEGQIRPRSSIRKTDLSLINAPGTIDCDYRGEIMVTFKPTRPARARKYEVGDRIAQLVIAPVARVTFEEVEELSETGRGAKGHGSTGGNIGKEQGV